MPIPGNLNLVNPPDVTHMMNFTRLPRFSVCIIEKPGRSLGTRLSTVCIHVLTNNSLLISLFDGIGGVGGIRHAHLKVE